MLSVTFVKLLQSCLSALGICKYLTNVWTMSGATKLGHSLACNLDNPSLQVRAPEGNLIVLGCSSALF